MNSRIPAAINLYNAQKYLREVLESLKTFYAVLKCGSKSGDSALTIAAEHGCGIVSFDEKHQWALAKKLNKKNRS